ncbi:hypothetical protein [Celeribacter sp.]|uniref:hypothetical protein n=1 Tax=Celeribacter sp. TaxID=1890673 RepID=UPI003A95396E
MSQLGIGLTEGGCVTEGFPRDSAHDQMIAAESQEVAFVVQAFAQRGPSLRKGKVMA